MTEKDVIEYLKNRYLVVGSPLNPTKEECKRHNAVIDMATEALRKQIPIKPVAVLGACDKPEYECKNCGDTIPDNMYEFCPWCGQAIDWSEEHDTEMD